MSVDLIDALDAALGVCERKKLETRLALVSEALELFAVSGAQYHDSARRDADRLGDVPPASRPSAR